MDSHYIVAFFKYFSYFYFKYFSIEVSHKMEEKVWEFDSSRLGGRVAGPRNNINNNNNRLTNCG